LPKVIALLALQTRKVNMDSDFASVIPARRCRMHGAVAFGFAIRCLGAHIWRMLRNPSNDRLRSKAFVRDVGAFFAAGHHTIKAHGIAALQLRALKQHYKQLC
jgi:hypothetical protein